MFFFLMIRRPPRSTLLPYTSLCRSATGGGVSILPRAFRGDVLLHSSLIYSSGSGDSSPIAKLHRAASWPTLFAFSIEGVEQRAGFCRFFSHRPLESALPLLSTAQPNLFP